MLIRHQKDTENASEMHRKKHDFEDEGAKSPKMDAKSRTSTSFL